MKVLLLLICALAIVATTVGLIVALSSSDDDPATGMAPEPTVAPSATVEAIAGIERVPVRWLPADVFDAASAVEMSEPFAAQQRQMVEIAVANGHDASSVGARWALYVAGASGTPRLIYETGRRIERLEWGSGGLTAFFHTRYSAPSAVLAGEAFLFWRGNVTVDPATGRVTDQLDPVPLDCMPCTADGEVNTQSSGAGLILERDGVNRQLLASVRVATGPARPPEPLFRLDGIYVTDLQGKGRKLEGLTGLHGADWFGNGKAIRARGGQATAGATDLYFIPIVDGEAIFIRRPLGYAVEGGILSGGNRVAFVLPGATDQTVRIGVYDSNTGQIRIVTERPAANIRFQESPLGRSVAVIWLNGRDEVQLGTPNPGAPNSLAELINVNTGAARQVAFSDINPPPPPEPPCPSNSPTPSPGGRFVLTADRRPPVNPGPSSQLCGAIFRLRIQDNQTGAMRTLLEAPPDACIDWEWWSGTKLRATVTSFCNAFHGPLPVQILVLDAQTGGSESLTDGLEESARIEAAPGGSYLLSTARRLRLYGNDGVLLRDYGPPPAGYEYGQRVWSPDGSSLAVLLGPANWIFGP